MTISRLPLGYCSNVHPGRCLDEVLEGLRRYAGPVGRNLGRPTSVGLWLAAPVVHELLSDRRKLDQLRATLDDERLCCYSLNAFPFGDFHKRRVKREVYRPDWADEQRLQYTLSCAQVLGELLPEDVDGSVSTLPLGFASDVDEVRFLCSLDRLVDCADQLAQLADRTGRVVRLALEPEPFCWLERTERVVTFFQKALWPHADRRGRLDAVRRHIGVCLDVCHQAVLFEDVGQSVRRLAEADVRVNKVHVTCALKVSQPGRHPETLSELGRFVESRYLHQTFARTADGRVLRSEDLTERLVRQPPTEWLDATEWRVHFHVPVHARRLGRLSTTQSELQQALAAVAGLPDAPHLEVETYTWSVLPGQEKAFDLVEGLTHELQAVHELVEQVEPSAADA